MTPRRKSSYFSTMIIGHVEFKRRVSAFLSETGMTPSAFGRLALNDHHFVKDLRKGKRKPRAEAREAVIAWMDEQIAARAAKKLGEKAGQRAKPRRSKDE